MVFEYESNDFWGGFEVFLSDFAVNHQTQTY